MSKNNLQTIKLTCKYCNHPNHFGVDGYQKCKECGCVVLETPTLPAEDWEFEFDKSRMVSALYYNIEAGEAEAIHVALRDFIRNLVTKVSSAAVEEERNKVVKEIVEGLEVEAKNVLQPNSGKSFSKMGLAYWLIDWINEKFLKGSK